MANRYSSDEDFDTDWSPAEMQDYVDSNPSYTNYYDSYGLGDGTQTNMWDALKAGYGGSGGTGGSSGSSGINLSGLAGLLGGGGSGWGGLGALLGSGIGAYGANKQAKALGSQSAAYEAMGAPYRSKLAALYANPDSFLSSKEVQVPVQQGTNALMRSLSMSGNPFGSGNALQQGQSYASDQLFGRLGQEKDRLAGFGGLSSYNQAAPQAASSAIGAKGGVYDAIGSGLGNIFNPPQTLAQQLAEFNKLKVG